MPHPGLTAAAPAAADASSCAPVSHAGAALVVFHGFGHGMLAHLFGRNGFRHCFVCLAHQGAWLRLDFQNGLPSLEMVCADTFDLAHFYRTAGLTVVATQRRPYRPDSFWLWPFMIASCVGTVKKILGVGAPYVLTPYQLYRFLSKEH
jgi:hypothetical protein